MKMILDVDNHGKTNKEDILIFDGKIWSTVSKNAFLRELIIRNLNLESALKEAFDRIGALETQMKIDHGEMEEVEENGMVE